MKTTVFIRRGEDFIDLNIEYTKESMGSRVMYRDEGPTVITIESVTRCDNGEQVELTDAEDDTIRDHIRAYA